MGHDHHFLARLDRVEKEELSLALDLYRNHEAVRYALGRIRIPDRAPRVALCLGPNPSEGPWAVVARDGGFVTCLGKGMRTGDLPIVPRGQLDAVVAHHEAQRRRIGEASRGISRFGSVNAFFERVFGRGASMSREDFVALSAFAPILSAHFHVGAMRLAATIPSRMRALVGISGIAPAHRASAKKLYEDYWAVGHRLLLAGTGRHLDYQPVLDELFEKNTGLSMFTFLLNSTTTLLRGLHVGARLGKMTLPGYKAAVGKAQGEAHIVDGIWGAVAIALRHSGTTTEVRRMLLSKPEGGAFDAYRQRHARIALEALDEPERRTEIALRWGRAHVRSKMLAAHLPESDPHSFATDDAVPDDLARTAVLSYNGAALTSARDLDLALSTLHLAASAKPEDFYFPREIVKKMVRPWTPYESLALADRFSGEMFCKKPLRRTEPKTGRNEPCRCASGRKYKRCCAAA